MIVAARSQSLYIEKLGADGLTLPFVPNWAEPVWHLFVVQSEERDALAESLGESGVQTLDPLPDPSRTGSRPMRKWACSEGSLPAAERLARSVLSLPIGPHMTNEQAHRVIEAVQKPG